MSKESDNLFERLDQRLRHSQGHKQEDDPLPLFIQKFQRVADSAITPALCSLEDRFRARDWECDIDEGTGRFSAWIKLTIRDPQHGPYSLEYRTGDVQNQEVLVFKVVSSSGDLIEKISLDTLTPAAVERHVKDFIKFYLDHTAP